MNTDKHILLIMAVLYAGGAEKQYRYIMEALSESNKVSVLLLNKPINGNEEHTNLFISYHK